MTKVSTQSVISFIYLTGYFIILYFKGKGDFPIDDITFGTLTALVPAIVHFWIGSSDGSKKKDLK